MMNASVGNAMRLAHAGTRGRLEIRQRRKPQTARSVHDDDGLDGQTRPGARGMLSQLVAACRVLCDTTPDGRADEVALPTLQGHYVLSQRQTSP
jgi:hypothetical protein